MGIEVLYLLAGMVGLYLGAELLVRGAAGIAKGLDIRPALVGLTLVAFGTSAPELTVTCLASAQGKGIIALGNIIGSNVANIGLVIGIVALVKPIRVERALIKREVPIGILASIAMFVMAFDGSIGRIDGIILVAGMVGFLILAVRQAIRERAQSDADQLPKPIGKLAFGIMLTVFGIAVVVGGGHLFLKSALFVARSFGISEFFIGITMVALGTSMPELATSFVAAFRKRDDLCVANVVGSNITNIFLGIGLAALISPIAVESSFLKNEFLFMIGFSLSLLPLIKTGLRINRIEGAILLAGYAAFIYFSYVN